MVKYPTGTKKTYVATKTSTSRRGMELEAEINQTNDYYLVTNVAVIHKKPTPVQIVNVSYPARSAAKITEAYFKLPSTTDYNGIYKGKYIDFEAKDCQSTTAFPLSSIHEHQIKHLRQVQEHGAIAFLIVRFAKKEETYYVPMEQFFSWYDHKTRNSIPYSWFQENAYVIPYRYQKPVDYVTIIDKIYFK